MGMYTEIVCGVKLRPGTPAVVIAALRFMVGDDDRPNELPDHPLFRKKRWQMVLNCSSYYFGFSQSYSVMHHDEFDKVWMLAARASVKNYDGEVEAFFDWIRPYVNSGSGERNMMGYSIYESADVPTIWYAEDIVRE